MDPTKKELYTAKRSSGVNVNYDSQVHESIQVLSQSSSINWMLMKIVNSNDLSLLQTGSHGVQEMLTYLTNDDIYYGFFKVTSRENGQVRFYSLYFIGENANGMKKGKSSLYKSGILNLMETNGEISFNNLTLSEYSFDYVLQEVSKLSKCSRDSLIV